MSLFRQLGDGDPSPIASWVPVVGCLVAGLFTAVLARPIPRPRGLVPLEVGASAALYVAIAFLAAVAAGWIGFAAFRPRTNIDVPAVVAVFAAAAVWFAPLIFFISVGYAWSVAIAGVVAVGLARLLRRYKRAAFVRQALPVWTAVRPMFDFAVQPVPFPHRFRILCAATFAQAAVISALSGRIGIAAGFAGLSCFMVAWWMAASDRYTVQSLQFRRSGIRVALNVILAIQLTASGLMPFVRRADARETEEQPNAKSEAGASQAAADRYSGIILIPEVQKQVTIVPPLPDLRRTLFSAGARNPLGVPFSGECWFFYGRRGRPPANSMVARGTPTEFKFTAAGRTALTMQGRQTFGTPIDPRCCSRIDLAITNADPVPAAVGIELILVNSALPERPSQALGERPVPPAENETLRFEIPAKPSIGVFDEMVIVFHLYEPRRGRSANISIDRFYFVPRGG